MSVKEGWGEWVRSSLFTSNILRIKSYPLESLCSRDSPEPKPECCFAMQKLRSWLRITAGEDLLYSTNFLDDLSLHIFAYISNLHVVTCM